MPKYTDAYSATFEETAKDVIQGKKTKRMLKKDILFILEEPYFKAKKIKEYSDQNVLRKNVCAGNFRIFYSVDETSKKVSFLFVRKKDKKTYKDL